MTPRQLVFVSEYLMSGNATAAYKLAYSTKDEQVAAAGASRLLRNVKVREYLQKFKNELMQKTGVTLERTIEEIAKVAYSNIADVLKAKKVSNLPEDVQRAISEITTVDTPHGKRRTIKMYNKLTALDQLMRHLGGYASVKDLVDQMDDAQKEELLKQLLDKLSHE